MADEIWQLVAEFETYAINCGEMLDVAIGKVRGEDPLQKRVRSWIGWLEREESERNSSQKRLRKFAAKLCEFT
ncbi:MAG: hypothetical protein FIA97_08105 [Methylococcaceae bacterium]|nr:hypothetical protein [Methylococcaceae bacterium]